MHSLNTHKFHKYIRSRGTFLLPILYQPTQHENRPGQLFDWAHFIIKKINTAILQFIQNLEIVKDEVGRSGEQLN